MASLNDAALAPILDHAVGQGRVTQPSAPLDERSLHLRRLVMRGLVGGNRGHVGSSMSPIEILRVLYDDVLRYRPQEPNWSGRDRFILSKGHGCLALYAILADKGFFDPSHLDKFCHVDGILGGHPEHGKVPGVEASTGALGHGFSIGVGMALAARMQQRDSRVFVVMGDGEINEGSVWEAAMCACEAQARPTCAPSSTTTRSNRRGQRRKFRNSNLCSTNGRRSDLPRSTLDGHDVASLRQALLKVPLATDKPTAIVCHTVKGKGIPFAENNPKWHHHAKFRPQELDDIYAALGGRR